MKITSIARISGVALASAFALSACGSESSDSATDGAKSAGSSATDAAKSGGDSGSADCGKKDLKAEGSSAQDNAIQDAIEKYGKTCENNVTYNATGSGNGIKQFIAGQVNFAGSDSALKTKPKDGKIETDEAKTACGSEAWNIPMVTGPIAVSYNLKDVKDPITLTPAVLADIFNGKITKWNDPAIAAVNKGVTLPAKDIKVFFRSDESGTTENFTKYLAASAKDKWTAEPGKKWTGKGEGKAKTAGVTSSVKSTDGGITYAEWSAAKDNELQVAKIDNGAGAVELTGASASKAISAAKIDGTGNDLRLKLDYATKEADAYPIVLVTYEVVCSKYKDAEIGKSVKSFLTYFAGDDIQKNLESQGYAPLPADIQGKVKTAVNAIQ
ncbi:phosphate ABC transporter substrate-binding protein PstS [Dermacoccus nishinomiyaensis]|uniref:phosphate ABC transporter substrate-binding protein PstS n=1 Tax=Dermacoccus nishinomiyaensis TaxID=1274 RepID=UPI0028B1250B|nr:phosphate ABC transporter substrate-binding protein PstS [Dermacoccus nishinomiyaensis]